LRYLPDTSAVIALLRAQAPADFGLSVVVLRELAHGARSARPEANLARVDALRFERLPLTAEDAAGAGRICAASARAGTPIGACHLLVAGRARARGLAVVIRNRHEFARVEGLEVEGRG
jgi:tRNA(fMet)-specific endonuclease VapC